MSRVEKPPVTQPPSSPEPFDPVVVGRRLADSKESVERAVPNVPHQNVDQGWSLKGHSVRSLKKLDPATQKTSDAISSRANQLGFHQKIGKKKDSH